MKLSGLKAILIITFILLLVAASSPMDWNGPLFSNDNNTTITNCTGPYTVRAGETLSMIATRCGLTVSEILANNQFIANPNADLTGQQIILPGAGNFALSSTTGQQTTANLTGIPVSGEQQVVTTGRASTYIVVRGDTLGLIAQRFGTTVPALLNSNPQIVNQDLIYVNQIINIPGR